MDKEERFNYYINKKDDRDWFIDDRVKEEEIKTFKGVVQVLNQQDQEIQELKSKLEEDFTLGEFLKMKEQLKNAIVLPIQIGEKCWTINCWVDYGDWKIGEPYTVTKYELHENIVSGYDIYKSMINNKLTLQVKPCAKTNYKGVQPYLFATKEEAKTKLEELKGERE